MAPKEHVERAKEKQSAIQDQVRVLRVWLLIRK